jgi:putative tryptophan/tyrosine transport system substrate-binding protein
MRRREFIAGLGGAMTWPMVARAQQAAMPVVGFLQSGAAAAFGHLQAAFHRGLRINDYIEGQNVAIEYRWADNYYDRLPALAADLVHRKVNVIGAFGPPAAAAAKAATASIPIIFTTGDAVAAGLVSSLNRPEGNLTGVNLIASELEAKRMALVLEMVPTATTVAVLINPKNGISESQARQVTTAAPTMKREVLVLTASSEGEFAVVFATLAARKVDALVIASDPFFNSRRDELVELATRQAIPTIYEWREFVLAGGLMSYGTSITDGYRQAGIYVGRILKGARPADLPVMQATKFELVINLKAAKALGRDIPLALQIAADEVIE